MSSGLWVALLLTVFAVCRWSGRILDRHYADRAELGAVMLVGLCVFLPFALGANGATIGGLTVKLPLALAIVGGLLVGHRAPAPPPS